MPDIILRIARTFTAEKLTKGWLMAVRRGWLSLLKPSIQNLGDVVKAIDKLDTFVDNLHKQVTYVRRGPKSTYDIEDSGKKLTKAFKDIKEVLKDHRERAEHWKGFLDGTSVALSWGEDRSDDARKMLDLYKEKFSAMLEGYVTTKGKGPGGKRVANILEYFDKLLEVLYEDAKAIAEHDKSSPDDPLVTDDSVFTDFMIGRMKIVIVDPEMKAGRIRAYVAYLDKALALLKKYGFDKVWYGITFVVSESSYEFGEAEKLAYSRYGYDISAKSGDFSPKSDAVRVWAPPGNFIVELMLHELGHRYWFKFMSEGNRAKFSDLLKTKDKESPESRKRDLDAKRVQEAESESKKDFEAATKDVVAVLRDFESTKFKKYKDLGPTWEPKLSSAVADFSNALLRSIGKASVQNKRETMADLDQLMTKLSARALYAFDEITSLMMKTPEPEGPVPNLTKYWNDIFAEQRKAWVAETISLVEQVQASAFVHLQASINEHNEREIANFERNEAEYGRLVAPVSGYAATNADEAFAEAFAHYCLGEAMGRDQLESFKTVLGSVEEDLEDV
jgi:hypothetical protein